MASEGTYGTTAVITSTRWSNSAGSGPSRKPSKTSTPFLRAQATAVESRSVATTRALGTSAARTAAIAPEPQQRSIATPFGGNNDAARLAKGMRTRNVDARLDRHPNAAELNGTDEPREW